MTGPGFDDDAPRGAARRDGHPEPERDSDSGDHDGDGDGDGGWIVLTPDDEQPDEIDQ